MRRPDKINSLIVEREEVKVTEKQDADKEDIDEN